ncbi:MAG: hypothetical protein R2705_00985 [Ilumatobacteraceae bacterium]
MGWFSSVAEAFEDAGEAFVDTMEDVGDGIATGAEGFAAGFDKDGWLTEAVQDYVPGGGFVTAIAHSAAGNNDYAELAAVKGLSTTASTVVSVAATAVLGPVAGGAVGGALGPVISKVQAGFKRCSTSPSRKSSTTGTGNGRSARPQWAACSAAGRQAHCVGEGVCEGNTDMLIEPAARYFQLGRGGDASDAAESAIIRYGMPTVLEQARSSARTSSAGYLHEHRQGHGQGRPSTPSPMRSTATTRRAALGRRGPLGSWLPTSWPPNRWARPPKRATGSW